MDFRVKRLCKLRGLPRPEDGLRKVVERAPQAEEALQRLARQLQPTWTLLYPLRRRIATSAVVLLTVWVSIHVLFGANGMVVYKQKRDEIQNLQKEVGDLQKQNNRYSDEIRGLKTDPKAIEKEAREQLRYARPGEVVYVPPDRVNVQKKPSTNSAKK